MAIKFERAAFGGRKQAFWRGEAKVLPGGFKVENRINIGAVIKRGAFLQINYPTLTCGLVKVGKVLTGGTTTKPRVAKDNYFEVGDEIIKIGGELLAVVKDVDHSNSEYDVITFDKAVTGLAAGDFIIEGVDDDGAKQRYTANAVVSADKEWKKNASEVLDAAYDVLVIRENVPEFPAEWIATGGFHLATNPNIRFITQ